jgi:TM2 domain-containing membrane protein YozV
MKPLESKSLALTIILSALISGLGEIYLGLIGRGLTILIAGFAIGFGTSLLLPFYLSLPIILVYWVWQIIDAYQQFKKIRPKAVGE